jgi:hypothetical protein
MIQVQAQVVVGRTNPQCRAPMPKPRNQLTLRCLLRALVGMDADSHPSSPARHLLEMSLTLLKHMATDSLAIKLRKLSIAVAPNVVLMRSQLTERRMLTEDPFTPTFAEPRHVVIEYVVVNERSIELKRLFSWYSTSAEIFRL